MPYAIKGKNSLNYKSFYRALSRWLDRLGGNAVVLLLCKLIWALINISKYLEFERTGGVQKNIEFQSNSRPSTYQ